MTYQELYSKFVTKDKAGEEKYNILDAYFFRKLSIFITLPISKTNIKPTTITKISIVFSTIGFILLSFGNSIELKLLGYLGFFLWALFDEVDGNIARYKNQCSMLGDLWDTMGGYAAMILIYFGAGIAGFYDSPLINYCENYWLLIMGGATAIFSIFPRLMMHKKKSSVGNTEEIKTVSDKQSFGVFNIIGMNLVSPTGFLQLFLFTSILLHCMNLFILMYLVINFGIMVISLYKIMK